MRFEGLDLNLLVALESLLETQSVTETAQRLNLSQPAISAALNRMREYFEDDLLIYVGRKMIPTAKGEELAPAITDMLNIARFKIAQSEGFDPATSRRCFKLIGSDYVFDLLVAKALAKAALEAPGVTFEIGQTGPHGARLFDKGDIDLLITVNDYVVEDHPSEVLFRDEDAVICWAEGRFRDGIGKQEFLDADFVKPVFGEEARPTVSDMYFRSQGLALRSAVNVPSFSALPPAVVGTDRIAVMHRGHAELFAALYPIRVHRLPVKGSNISEIAQWHRLRRNDNGVEWLLGLLRAEVRSLSFASR